MYLAVVVIIIIIIIIIIITAFQYNRISSELKTSEVLTVCQQLLVVLCLVLWQGRTALANYQFIKLFWTIVHIVSVF